MRIGKHLRADNDNKVLLHWIPAIIMMAVIFIASSTPSTRIPNFGLADFVIKKSGHAIGYGLLGLAFWYGMKFDRVRVWHAWVLAVFYATSDEFHQSFVPGRHAWWVDVAIDSFSAALVLTFTAWWRRRKNRSG